MSDLVLGLDPISGGYRYLTRYMEPVLLSVCRSMPMQGPCTIHTGIPTYAHKGAHVGVLDQIPTY